MFQVKNIPILKQWTVIQTKTAPGYLNSTYIAKQQLPVELRIVEREDSGYVVSLMADDKYSGSRNLLLQGWDLLRLNFSMQKKGVTVRACAEEKDMGLVFLSMAEMNWQKMEKLERNSEYIFSGDGNYKKLDRTVYFEASEHPVNDLFCKKLIIRQISNGMDTEMIMSRGE